MTSVQANMAAAAAISAGRTTIDWAPGVYAPNIRTTTANGLQANYIFDGGGIDTKDLTIDGHGAILQVQAPDTPYGNVIEIQNFAIGSHVTLQNFSLAYKYKPFAQGIIQSVKPCVKSAGGTVTFAPQDGYLPPWAGTNRIDLMDRHGLFVVNIADYGRGRARLPLSVSGSTYTVMFNGATACNQLANPSVAVGQVYELYSNQFGATTANSGYTTRNVEFYHVYDVTLDNVKVSNSAGTGFEILGAHDVALVHGSGCRKAPGQYRSSAAGCFAGIYIGGVLTTDKTIYMRGCGDDCLFAAPYNTTVASVAGNVVTLAGLPNISNGDLIKFADASGAYKGKYQITAFSGMKATFGLGLPSGVAAGWSLYDASNAPSLVSIDGGSYGDTPNRPIYVSGDRIIMDGPEVSNSGSVGILVQYGAEGNLGTIPTSVSINEPKASNNNYSHVMNGVGGVGGPAAIMVAGFAKNSERIAAPEGQIPSVSVSKPVCDRQGEGCVYIASALNASVTKPIVNAWYLNQSAAPYMHQATASRGASSCSVGATAIAFCNVGNVTYDPPAEPSRSP